MASKVENYFIENKQTNLAELKAAKNLIWQGDLSKINRDPMIKQALNLFSDCNAEKYLQQHHQTTQSNIKQEIVDLTKNKNTKLAQSINDGFSVAGAVMLAIPIPPVMIAGAAILLASSVAGIVIKFREPIANAFKNLLGLNKSPAKPVIEAPKAEPPKVTHVVAKAPQKANAAAAPVKAQAALNTEKNAEETSSSPRMK